MQKSASPMAQLTGIIRQLRPSDLPRFRDHLLRLDVESRRDRFNGFADDSFVTAYADRCFAKGTTVIGYVEDDRVLGAAELHERPEIEEPTGEIAFSVERELQHRTIGGRLFERLIANARWLGYTRLLVTTHPQNQAMKALARKFNAALSFDAGETVGVIELDPPVPVFTKAASDPFVMARGARAGAPAMPPAVFFMHS
ncbi:GNAT family N-acetyltransferase [Pseudaminobacter soli (ex Li et al. 2025)]|uniref:GNAT family N-acetyltransferase n=1 Tax=Pseudaminobacter soli (ex Li et al. 2025) TaxID=1295366 RepID=A0A2P7SBH9_9HYPH|nr:GNAT family N-acetyltransferase [Mesorhizobium soli]PSJ59711.1 GNAT family N-acetyltransferase [Mesorhizobium soli]